MATQEQLENMLRNADAAGDEKAARMIVAEMGKASSSPQEDKQSPEYERNWYDAPRAALQGMTLGWSDELGALAGAGMAKGAQFFNDDETEFGNIYDQMMGRLTEERKEYGEANPIESTALNIVGGLGTGLVSGAKILGKEVVRNLPRLQKALVAMGVGGTEGAIAGAGSADEGKRAEGALFGGTVGTVLPGALALGGKVLDTATVQRVVEEMKDAAGNFLPINQALPEGSTLGNIYQKIIGPSFGGQQLREQNRGVLERSLKKLEDAKATSETAKTTGKKALESQLRNQVKMESLPNNISDVFKEKILKSDGSDAIKNIDQAWNQGFDVVKSKTFQLDPKKLVDEVIADLSGPMDAEFAGKISSAIRNKLSGGFTADTAAPDVKFLTKGMGSQKAPKVELESGEVDGAWLMQARNDLRMRANELVDSGADALEVHALKSSARKIDDLIREGLDEADVAIFDKELKNWGNYQAAKGATRKAGTTQQGLYEPQQLLQTLRTNQQRKFDLGDAQFKQEAQDLQVMQKGIMDEKDIQVGIADKALKEVKGKLPNLNPDPWTKGVSTGTLGGAPLSIMPGVDPTMAAAGAIPLGYTLGKIASTEGVQKTIAGQTGLQRTIAELLRQYEGSAAQQGLKAGEGALTRDYIMSNQGE